MRRGRGQRHRSAREALPCPVPRSTPADLHRARRRWAGGRGINTKKCRKRQSDRHAGKTGGTQEEAGGEARGEARRGEVKRRVQGPPGGGMEEEQDEEEEAAAD